MKIERISAMLPHFCRGLVVKGFGRGSKELGIPTANFPESVVEALPAEMPTGIYYGWAQVDAGDIHEMVMSVGWNPFYQNRKKSMETHIMHLFTDDFYNSTLSVVMVGFVRGEKNFDSLEELVSAINNDIEIAREKLNTSEALSLKENDFFARPSRLCSGKL